MRPPLPCILLLATACGGSGIKRPFDGSCELSADGRSTELMLGFEAGGSSQVEGRTHHALDTWNDDEDLDWAGALIGAGEASYDLDLEGSAPDSEADITFHLEAELSLDGSELAGPATYWVETAGDSSIVYAGDCLFLAD